MAKTISSAAYRNLIAVWSITTRFYKLRVRLRIPNRQKPISVIQQLLRGAAGAMSYSYCARWSNGRS
jgi:hypothetical protein